MRRKITLDPEGFAAELFGLEVSALSRGRGR